VLICCRWPLAGLVRVVNAHYCQQRDSRLLQWELWAPWQGRAAPGSPAAGFCQARLSTGVCDARESLGVIVPMCVARMPAGCLPVDGKRFVKSCPPLISP
jgi:hypothetical protein